MELFRPSWDIAKTSYNYENKYARERICSPNSVRLVTDGFKKINEVMRDGLDDANLGGMSAIDLIIHKRSQFFSRNGCIVLYMLFY